MNNPYIPIPIRLPNKVVKTYNVPFFDGTRYATLTKVDYKDKKGKLHIGYVMFVKWEEQE